MANETTELKGWKKYCAEQNISFTSKRIFIDGLGGMALGLFASLLIGCIISTISTYLFDFKIALPGLWAATDATVTGLSRDGLLNVLANKGLMEMGKTGAYAVQGAAMACAIAYAMKAPPFVLYSCLTVGYISNILGGAGGPLAVYFVTVIAVFCGKLVSKRTPVDLIVTPAVTIILGSLVAFLLSPPIGKLASLLGTLVMEATQLQPFLMGIICSALMGIILTLPISSAAICAALGLVGLAGGACVAGCCAHMVGFAVASYRENGVGGLLSQGLGTSMLQVPNLVRKPKLWIPPVIASIVNGPIATCVFKLQMNGVPISSGMGTSGLVGPIGVITGWINPSDAAKAADGGKLAVDIAGAAAQSPAVKWIGLLVICIIIPALISWLVSEFMRKKGWIELGDYKLDL